MGIFGKKQENLILELDTEELSTAQIRMVKSLNSLLLHVITTKDESDFFDGSAEFMRVCASLIQKSRFSSENTQPDDIAYADQALEYSMDILQEYINDSKIVQYDN
jgi:hypothetical protein